MSEVARDAAEAFAPQARDLGLDLRVETADAIPGDVDPDRVAQIVANLVENALKYATARIEVTAEQQPDGRISIVVTDDGPGIPSSDIDHVFERLYTARSTPGRAVGTGLGLAIVHELATAMGGTAFAEAPESGGTRFVVKLPRRVAPAPEPARS